MAWNLGDPPDPSDEEKGKVIQFPKTAPPAAETKKAAAKRPRAPSAAKPPKSAPAKASPPKAAAAPPPVEPPAARAAEKAKPPAKVRDEMRAILDEMATLDTKAPASPPRAATSEQPKAAAKETARDALMTYLDGLDAQLKNKRAPEPQPLPKPFYGPQSTSTNNAPKPESAAGAASYLADLAKLESECAELRARLSRSEQPTAQKYLAMLDSIEQIQSEMKGFALAELSAGGREKAMNNLRELLALTPSIRAYCVQMESFGELYEKAVKSDSLSTHEPTPEAGPYGPPVYMPEVLEPNRVLNFQPYTVPPPSEPPSNGSSGPWSSGAAYWPPSPPTPPRQPPRGPFSGNGWPPRFLRRYMSPPQATATAIFILLAFAGMAAFDVKNAVAWGVVPYQIAFVVSLAFGSLWFWRTRPREARLAAIACALFSVAIGMSGNIGVVVFTLTYAEGVVRVLAGMGAFFLVFFIVDLLNRPQQSQYQIFPANGYGRYAVDDFVESKPWGDAELGGPAELHRALNRGGQDFRPRFRE